MTLHHNGYAALEQRCARAETSNAHLVAENTRLADEVGRLTEERDRYDEDRITKYMQALNESKRADCLAADYAIANEVIAEKQAIIERLVESESRLSAEVERLTTIQRGDREIILTYCREIAYWKSQAQRLSRITFSKVDYCVMSAALTYAEQHKEVWPEIETAIKRMLATDTIHPVTDSSLDVVNQVLWQHHDNLRDMKPL